MRRLILIGASFIGMVSHCQAEELWCAYLTYSKAHPYGECTAGTMEDYKNFHYGGKVVGGVCDAKIAREKGVCVIK
jgi:hypothetical protein